MTSENKNLAIGAGLGVLAVLLFWHRPGQTSLFDRLLGGGGGGGSLAGAGGSGGAIAAGGCGCNSQPLAPCQSPSPGPGDYRQGFAPGPTSPVVFLNPNALGAPVGTLLPAWAYLYSGAGV